VKQTENITISLYTMYWVIPPSFTL